MLRVDASHDPYGSIIYSGHLQVYTMDSTLDITIHKSLAVSRLSLGMEL